MKLPLRQLLLAMLGGVLLYGVFVVYTGYQTVAQSVQTFHWGGFGWAVGLASLNYLLRFAKWEYYLAQLGIRGVPKADSLLIFLSGFVLTVSPGKVGEVFKSAVLARTYGVAGHLTAPIVVAERLTDIIAVVLLILAGSTALAGGLVWAALGAVVVSLGLGSIYWPPPALWALDKLAPTRLGFLTPKLKQAYGQLQRLATPRMLVVPTVLSCIGWGCEGYALACILTAFNEHVATMQSVFFYATSTLAGALVPVPGGLGVTDGLIQQQLVRVAAVDEGTATTSMLLIRIATLWWAVVVGFLALGLLRLRFGKGLRAGKSLPQPPLNA